MQFMKLCTKYIWVLFVDFLAFLYKSDEEGINFTSLMQISKLLTLSRQHIRCHTECRCFLCSRRRVFDHYSLWWHAPCAMWKMAIGFYWQMKCVWSVLIHCHPPKSWALQQLSRAASHSEAFYSLWISVKSLSSHTALCSPPLFSTLGGHFSSNSVKERARFNSTESVCFILDMNYLSLAMVNSFNILYFSSPWNPGLNYSTLWPTVRIVSMFISWLLDSILSRIFWLHLPFIPPCSTPLR